MSEFSQSEESIVDGDHGLALLISETESDIEPIQVDDAEDEDECVPEDASPIPSSPKATLGHKRRRSASEHVLWTHVSREAASRCKSGKTRPMRRCNHCSEWFVCSHTGHIRQHLVNNHKSVNRTVAFDERAQKKEAKLTFNVDRLSYKNVVRRENTVVMNFAVALRPFRQVDCPTFRVLIQGLPLITRQALKKYTIDFAKKLLALRMESYKNGEATLCVDGGKVYNKYMGVTLCVSGFAPILYDMPYSESLVATEGPDEGKLNAAAIGRHLKAVVKSLEENHGITVTAVCADNASVMQAEAATVRGTLHVRCGAHIVNLVAQDLKKDSWIETVHERAVAILNNSPDKIRLPKMVATRWNCLLRLVENILKKDESAQHDFQIDDDDRALFHRAVENLRPLLACTNALQSDSATLFDGFVAFSSLVSAAGSDTDFGKLIKISLEKPERKCMFNQDYLLLFTFLCPGCNRFELGTTLVTKCISIFQQTTSLFPKSTKPETINAEVWECVGAGRDEAHPSVDVDVFRNYWRERSVHYPNLYHAVESLLRVVPSEASVERIFSLLGNCMSSTRTRAAHEGIFAQMQLKTLYSNMWPKTKNDESSSSSDEEELEKLDPAEKAVIKGCIDECTLNAMAAYLKSGVFKPRPKLQGVNTCKYCPLPLYNHAKQLYVVCSVCKGVVSVECVGYPEGGAEELAARKNWKCRICMRVRDKTGA